MKKLMHTFFYEPAAFIAYFGRSYIDFRKCATKDDMLRIGIAIGRRIERLDNEYRSKKTSDS